MSAAVPGAQTRYRGARNAGAGTERVHEVLRTLRPVGQDANVTLWRGREFVEKFFATLSFGKLAHFRISTGS